MKAIKFIILLGMCFSLVTSLNAQKQKQKAKAEKTKDTLPPQPPKYLPPDVKMDSVKSDDLQEKKIDAVDRWGADFDTTAAPDDELTKAIKRYFEVTNAIGQASDLIKVLYESDDMKQIIPDDFRLRLIKAYERGGVGFKYLELITIRSYRKYYTKEDMEEMIKFYQTPLGKKMVMVSPMLLKENTLEGQKLGKWVATQIQ